MIFQFLHLNYPCTAFVIYEPTQVKDTMIVYTLDFIDQLGKEILFIEYEDKKWKCVSFIKERYPSTYENLCSKLTELFEDHKFVFDDEFSRQEMV